MKVEVGEDVLVQLQFVGEARDEAGQPLEDAALLGGHVHLRDAELVVGLDGSRVR